MWHILRFVLLKKMGIQGQSLQDLAECALLHDNAVAQYIQEELQNDALRNGVTKLGRHCTIGEKNLKNIPFHNDVSNVILYPHENADGSEPFGKQWNEVPLFARIGILMDALMASLQEILKLSDEQLTAFTADFEARLPKYLRSALHPEAVVA